MKLNFKILFSGFDYEYRVVCKLEAKVGKYIISDAEIVKGKKSWVYEYPLITITSVEDDKVDYVIPGEYVEGDFPVMGTIFIGETKEYSCVINATNTIYDEDYDYTIERALEIECE